ncbi:hypothetical protein [Catellatospora methionotrophica]|nr:hypothetical protein [Catellatospora methionotrophica]
MIALTPDFSRPWWEWGWADITTWVRWDPGVTITSGRGSEDSRVSSTSASAILTNTDGRFSRQNPFSPYAPYLKRFTPIWFSVNPGSGWIDRAHLYIDNLPKRWDTTGTDATVDISCSGILNQLVDAPKLGRPLYRAVSRSTGLIGYWTLEDGATASTAESALGHGQLRTFGTVAPLFAAVDGPPGGSSAPDFASQGGLYGRLPTVTNTGAWQATLWFRTLEGDSSTFTASVPLQWDMIGGTFPAFDILLFVGRGDGNPGLGNIGFNIAAYTASPPSESFRSETLAVEATVPNIQGTWRQLRVTMAQNGGNVDIAAYLDGSLLGVASDTGTLGVPGAFVVNPCQDQPGANAYAGVDGIGIASISTLAWYNHTADPNTYDAGLAYVGEQAHERMLRVADEENIPFYCLASESEPLGPQDDVTALEVFRAGEKADGGALFEALFGLGYEARSQRYDSTVVLFLDQALEQTSGNPQSSDDGTNFRNQWTANRQNGGSVTVTAPGVDPARDRVVGSSDTYEVATDDQLLDAAAWQVHLGTVDEDRWPDLGLNLANHPELIAQWVAMPPFGGRINVANPFSQAAIALIDVLREGTTEHWNSKQWEVSNNTSPASTYDVGVWGADDGSGTADLWGADDTVLAADITASQTSITLNAGNDVWAIGDTVSEPATFPFNVDIGSSAAHLTYSCTAITGTHPNLTMTIVRLGTDRSWPAGISVTVTNTGLWG